MGRSAGVTVDGFNDKDCRGCGHVGRMIFRSWNEHKDDNGKTHDDATKAQDCVTPFVDVFKWEHEENHCFKDQYYNEVFLFQSQFFFNHNIICIDV